MKQLLLSTSALLLLAGCAQNAPDVDANALNADTISVDEGQYGTESGNFNSSSDGFVSIYFDFDGYSVAPAMEGRMQQNAQRMRSVGGSKVKIEGNCDEFGTDEYNYALGLKRAKAVKDALTDSGVNTSNVVMVSYGESNAVCTDGTDECYARNRRTDLRIAR